MGIAVWTPNRLSLAFLVTISVMRAQGYAPLRTMAFLIRSRDRQVLRQVGAVYISSGTERSKVD